MLTMHVNLADDAQSPTASIREVKLLLKREYGIGHSTIEIEYDDCADDDADD